MTSSTGIGAKRVHAAGTVNVTLNGDPVSDVIDYWDHTTLAPSGWRKRIAFGGGFRIDYNIANAVQVVTGPNTTANFGRASGTVPYMPWFPNGLAIGGNDQSDTRVYTTGTVAPTTGVHAVGEIVFNVAPTAGGTIGWTCTTAGSPGSWKTFRAIAA